MRATLALNWLILSLNMFYIFTSNLQTNTCSKLTFSGNIEGEIRQETVQEMTCKISVA